MVALSSASVLVPAFGGDEVERHLSPCIARTVRIMAATAVCGGAESESGPKAVLAIWISRPQLYPLSRFNCRAIAPH